MAFNSSQEAIIDFAAKCAKEEWAKTKEPYLISRLGQDLTKEGIDYKGTLGEVRLADFIRSEHGRVKIISHPIQKAKIGLIPMNEEFEYIAESSPRKPTVGQTASKSKISYRQKTVSNFLALVSELDDVEAAQVQIPTNILTKLMRD